MMHPYFSTVECKQCVPAIQLRLTPSSTFRKGVEWLLHTCCYAAACENNHTALLVPVLLDAML
jgi:hypothetical protein